MFKNFFAAIAICVMIIGCGAPVDQSASTDTSNTPVITDTTPFIAYGSVIINNRNMSQNTEYQCWNVTLDAKTKFPNVELSMMDGTWHDPLATMPLPVNESIIIKGKIAGTTLVLDPISGFHGKSFNLPELTVHDAMLVSFNSGDNYGAIMLLRTADTYVGGAAYYNVSETEKINGMMMVSESSIYVVQFDEMGGSHFMNGSCTPLVVDSGITLSQKSGLLDKVVGTVKYDTMANSYYIDGTMTGINGKEYPVKWYYGYDHKLMNN